VTNGVERSEMQSENFMVVGMCGGHMGGDPPLQVLGEERPYLYLPTQVGTHLTYLFTEEEI